MSYQYTITSRYCYHNGEIVDMFFIKRIPFTFDDLPTIMQDDPYIQIETKDHQTYTIEDISVVFLPDHGGVPSPPV